MKKYIIIVLSLFSLSSCVSFKYSQRHNTTSLNPDIVELRMNMSDLDYLGSSEISTKSRQYFGVFCTIDSVNNVAYNPRLKCTTQFSGISDCKIRGPLKKAAYKVIEDYPEASFYVAESQNKKVKQMFLGRWIWNTMKFHAYKHKTNH